MPSAVQIYRINYSYWETFDFTSSRTFVCEQGLSTVKLYIVLYIGIRHLTFKPVLFLII